MSVGTSVSRLVFTISPSLSRFLRHVPPTAIDLIYWRQPIRSAVALTVSLALLISFAYFSVISVVANAALVVLVVAFAYVGFKKTVAAVQKTNEGHPFKVRKKSSVQENKVHCIPLFPKGREGWIPTSHTTPPRPPPNLVKSIFLFAPRNCSPLPRRK